MLQRLLAHPLTRGLDIDAPETTLLRRRIIRQKSFLKKLYQEWYTCLAGALSPMISNPVLELGSGGGFLREIIPDVLASEVYYLPGLDLILDGLRLPFPPASLGGVVMTNVLHHIPQPQVFFEEIQRCLVVGGSLAMIEPWFSPWSRWVYQRLHHEPFDPEMPCGEAPHCWKFPSSGPLSGANGALPWIIFQRDRARFASLFPGLHINRISPCMPFSYLLSGGVSMRSLAPGWSFPLVRSFERMLQPWIDQSAMFACIVVRKI